MSELKLDIELYPRQMDLFLTEATEVLFGGSMEGGKSHALRACNIVWCLDIPELQCLLIRKKFEDIRKNHVLGPTGFEALLRDFTVTRQVKITQFGIHFRDTHSNIDFMHCQDERQFQSAQGSERHVVNVDEATQIVAQLLGMFRGWARMPLEMKRRLPKKYQGRFPRINYTANPVGPSVSHFKREFVDARAPFVIEEVDGFLRQYIPSSVHDNPSADLKAHEGRKKGFKDPALIAALGGDWNAFVGDFFPEWNDKRHVVADFLPPPWWSRFRTFDWGTAEPFAVYWFAVSDGESFVDFQGNTRWFPRDALVAYKEWYGCDIEEPEKGNRMRNEDIAYGILSRSQLPEEANMLTISDSLPFQDRGGKTIAQTFYDCGVPLIHGDTSRVPGWSAMRSRLIGEEIDSNDGYKTPMLYFLRSCRYAAEYIPTLPRHKNPDKKEDAAEHGEATHCCDAIRLACLARTHPKAAPAAEPDISKATSTPTFGQAIKIIQKHKKRKAHASAY